MVQYKRNTTDPEKLAHDFLLDIVGHVIDLREQGCEPQLYIEFGLWDERVVRVYVWDAVEGSRREVFEMGEMILRQTRFADAWLYREGRLTLAEALASAGGIAEVDTAKYLREEVERRRDAVDDQWEAEKKEMPAGSGVGFGALARIAQE